MGSFPREPHAVTLVLKEGCPMAAVTLASGQRLKTAKTPFLSKHTHTQFR